MIQDAIAANELDDPPEAARQERALLLVQFAHPAPFADRDAVIDFVSQCDATAAKEDATLAKLGKDAGQAVIQHPQAFPQTWADQLAKSLDLLIATSKRGPARQTSADTSGNVFDDNDAAVPVTRHNS